MDFISLNFIIFVVITYAAYYFFGWVFRNTKIKKFVPQWSILLISSLIFYGLANWVYLIYLGISTFLSYCGGLLVQYKCFKKAPNEENAYVFNPTSIEKHENRKRYENIITALTILINLGILVVLKYYNFFAESVNSIFHINLVNKNFIIPLGISFYTFSLIAYNVDICRREIDAEKNILKLVLFVSYFPRIIQGPISSYKKIKEDGMFESHKINDVNYLKALFRISVGLVKKLAIANVLGMYVDSVYSHIETTSGVELAAISIFYTIQLFCDFSGFMDIVLGISFLFGINLEENFNIPYISLSIQEFWRRWHITLGNWLKKYIYIPLGGNRVKLWRWAINILIVWLVSGLWHGANFTFIIWGLIHGVILVLEGLPRQIKKTKHLQEKQRVKQRSLLKILRILLTFLIVNFAWIFFRSSSLPQAIEFIKRTFMIWNSGTYSSFSDTIISKANWLLIISGVVCVILVLVCIYSHYSDRLALKIHWLPRIRSISKYVLTVLFFSLALFMFFYSKSIGGGDSSFIYFDF